MNDHTEALRVIVADMKASGRNSYHPRISDVIILIGKDARRYKRNAVAKKAMRCEIAALRKRLVEKAIRKGSVK